MLRRSALPSLAIVLAIALAVAGCVGAVVGEPEASPASLASPSSGRADPASTSAGATAAVATSAEAAATPRVAPGALPTPPGSIKPGPLPQAAASPSPHRVYFPDVRLGAGTAAGVAAATPTSTATLVPTATPTVIVATPTPVPAGPTATPVPAPTATPRAKLPPSPYQKLQDYPRPPGDTGFGFHINAEPHVPKAEVLRSQVIPLLKQLHATWVTVWVSSDFDSEAEGVKLLTDAGFEVVVRYHDINPPHAGYVPSVEGLRKLRAAGANYFVTGNEPNLKLENPARAAPDLIAQQWVRSAERVRSVGGIPLLYPMSPGGGGDVSDSRTMLVGILEWLKANDALDTLDGAAVAIHNRPMGKPLEVRDSTSFLEYEWIDDTVASYAGKHLPLIGTEAGYAFGEQVLPQYPRIDGELHKQYNLAIINGFRDGRWRDSLFAQTFWVLGGFGYDQFIGDWWVGNPLNYGKDLPIVEALKAQPPFTRKFNAPGFQTRPAR